MYSRQIIPRHCQLRNRLNLAAQGELAWFLICFLNETMLHVGFQSLSHLYFKTKSAGQVCRSRLPATYAGHVCRPRLPATSAGHVYRPRLPATSAGHVYRPRLPAKSAGQVCRPSLLAKSAGQASPNYPKLAQASPS
jgi:hypothetical protein